MKKFNLSIANRIETFRKEKGISWENLAYSSGISKGGLSDIKNGIVEPRLSTIYKILATLNISSKDFFDFTPDLSEFE